MAGNIVPTDAPSIFDPLASLSTLNLQAIIRPNNPPPGIAGYLIDIVTDDRVSLRSGITDHYVEDNDTIQDQIALAPELVDVRGIVAELVLRKPTQQQLQPTPNPLTNAPGMEPVGTPGSDQQEAIDAEAAVSAEADAAASQSLYGYYAGGTDLNETGDNQRRIFGFFYQLWKGRQLFTVETPWGFFADMAILTLDFIQTEESSGKSEIAITFKKIRRAQELTVNLGQLAGRAQAQQAPETQNGNLGKVDLSPLKTETFLHFMLGGP